MAPTACPNKTKTTPKPLRVQLDRFSAIFPAEMAKPESINVPACCVPSFVPVSSLNFSRTTHAQCYLCHVRKNRTVRGTQSAPLSPPYARCLTSSLARLPKLLDGLDDGHKIEADMFVRRDSLRLDAAKIIALV